MAEEFKKSTSGWRAVLKNIVSLTPYWGSVVYIVAIKWQDGLTENNAYYIQFPFCDWQGKRVSGVDGDQVSDVCHENVILKTENDK